MKLKFALNTLWHNLLCLCSKTRMAEQNEILIAKCASGERDTEDVCVELSHSFQLQSYRDLANTHLQLRGRETSLTLQIRESHALTAEL